jgi:hypothetical protein
MMLQYVKLNTDLNKGEHYKLISDSLGSNAAFLIF